MIELETFRWFFALFVFIGAFRLTLRLRPWRWASALVRRG